MSIPAARLVHAGRAGSVPSARETGYLSRPEGRIGYDVAGDGSLVVLVPGMGDLRAGYRFLAPALREAGYRVACTDLRGHGDSDATFTPTAMRKPPAIHPPDRELGGPAVVVGNSMGAGAAVLARRAARTGLRPGAGRPFVRERRDRRDPALCCSRPRWRPVGGDLMEVVHAEALRWPAPGRLRRVPRPRRGEPPPAGIRESVLPHHRPSGPAEARLADVAHPPWS